MSGIVGSYFNTRGSGVVAKLGTDGQVFTSTGAGLSQGFEAAAGGGLDHIFSVVLSSGQSLSASTVTKITWDSEEIDTDNAFASNKFTVPSGADGKYFFYTFAVFQAVDARIQKIWIYKNNASVKGTQHYTDVGEYDDLYDLQCSAVLDLSADDYIEVFVSTDGSSIAVTEGTESSFHGFKLA